MFMFARRWMDQLLQIAVLSLLTVLIPLYPIYGWTVKGGSMTAQLATLRAMSTLEFVICELPQASELIIAEGGCAFFCPFAGFPRHEFMTISSLPCNSCRYCGMLALFRFADMMLQLSVPACLLYGVQNLECGRASFLADPSA